MNSQYVVWLVLLTLAQAILLALRIIEKKRNGHQKNSVGNPISLSSLNRTLDDLQHTADRLSREAASLAASHAALEKRVDRLESCVDSLKNSLMRRS